MSGPCDDEREVATESSHQEQALRASTRRFYLAARATCGTLSGDTLKLVAEIAGTDANAKPASALLGPGCECSEFWLRLISCSPSEVSG